MAEGARPEPAGGGAARSGPRPRDARAPLRRGRARDVDPAAAPASRVDDRVRLGGTSFRRHRRPPMQAGGVRSRPAMASLIERKLNTTMTRERLGSLLLTGMTEREFQTSSSSSSHALRRNRRSPPRLRPARHHRLPAAHCACSPRRISFGLSNHSVPIATSSISLSKRCLPPPSRKRSASRQHGSTRFASASLIGHACNAEAIETIATVYWEYLTALTAIV